MYCRIQCFQYWLLTSIKYFFYQNSCFCFFCIKFKNERHVQQDLLEQSKWDTPKSVLKVKIFCLFIFMHKTEFRVFYFSSTCSYIRFVQKSKTRLKCLWIRLFSLARPLSYSFCTYFFCFDFLLLSSLCSLP